MTLTLNSTFIPRDLHAAVEGFLAKEFPLAEVDWEASDSPERVLFVTHPLPEISPTWEPVTPDPDLEPPAEDEADLNSVELRLKEFLADL